MKKALFYYPQHFNRTSKGTNPFFDKMLDICDKRGIPYDLYEEPDGATDKPRNPLARKADAFFWMTTIIRTIVRWFTPGKTFFDREKYVANAINILTWGYFRRPVYITISGSMYHLFSYLNPNAQVYDMQHGVIGKFHPTFFDSQTGRLREQFYRKNLNLIFWGEGYANCFVKGEVDILKGRTQILGYPVENKIKDISSDDIEKKLKNKIVVVSMQLTHSVDNTELENMKAILDKFLAEATTLPVKIYLKHHPRYNNCISIDDLLIKYPGVTLTNEPLSELTEASFLHVTHFSTTAFEFAQAGIPTFFLPYENKSQAQTLFYDEYKYPLYLGMSIGSVIERLSDKKKYVEDSSTITEWYNQFYSPFDEVGFLKIIQTAQ